MKRLLLLFVGMCFLVGCGHNHFTKLRTKHNLVLLTKYDPFNGPPTTVKLSDEKKKKLIKELQEAGQHIIDPKGTRSCPSISPTTYVINIFYSNTDTRTFSNTGVCGGLYDQSDDLSLKSSVFEHIDEYF